MMVWKQSRQRRAWRNRLPIVMGTGITSMAPGSQQGVQVVVTDVEEARRELSGRGVVTSEIDDQPWGRFIHFSDPVGNSWSVQQIPARPEG